MSERSKESHSRCDVATREGSNPSLCIFLLLNVPVTSALNRPKGSKRINTDMRCSHCEVCLGAYSNDIFQ